MVPPNISWLCSWDKIQTNITFSNFCKGKTFDLGITGTCIMSIFSAQGICGVNTLKCICILMCKWKSYISVSFVSHICHHTEKEPHTQSFLYMPLWLWFVVLLVFLEVKWIPWIRQFCKHSLVTVMHAKWNRFMCGMFYFCVLILIL
jgi:hypothetical protein